MNIKKVIAKALDKGNFKTLQGYIDFAQHYLDFTAQHLQAIIISQNENHYQFYQYDKHGNYQITRPVNSDLMYKSDTFSIAGSKFWNCLQISKTLNRISKLNGNNKQCYIYNPAINRSCT